MQINMHSLWHDCRESYIGS